VQSKAGAWAANSGCGFLGGFAIAVPAGSGKLGALACGVVVTPCRILQWLTKALSGPGGPVPAGWEISQCRLDDWHL